MIYSYKWLICSLLNLRANAACRGRQELFDLGPLSSLPGRGNFRRSGSPASGSLLVQAREARRHDCDRLVLEILQCFRLDWSSINARSAVDICCCFQNNGKRNPTTTGTKLTKNAPGLFGIRMTASLNLWPKPFRPERAIRSLYACSHESPPFIHKLQPTRDERARLRAAARDQLCQGLNACGGFFYSLFAGLWPTKY